MNSLLGRSKRYLDRNASTILTVMGGVGVVATAILAAKATPKALSRIEEVKKEKGEEVTKADIVWAATPAYIPTFMTGVTTLACIFGANMLNKRQQAALMSAYALLDNSYKEYKEKLKELYGEEAHRNIISSIAIEKAEDRYISAASYCSTCDLSVEDNDGEPKTFYDEYSERYFEATIEQVMAAEYHLNRNYILRGYAVLNEFYEFLGIETTDYGSVLGWCPHDEGMYWIDFNHHKVQLEDGLECYIIEMPFAPSYDWDDY